MHCIHCGAEIPDSAKFCTACGQPVQAAPAEPEQPAAAEAAPEAEGYEAPENASEGYKAANAQLPPAYSNPNYAQSSASYTAAPGTTNGMAIAGFVCSLVFLPVALGALTAVAGLVLSIMGLNAAKKLPENKGHGLALAGAIISGIRVVLVLIGLVALIALMFRGIGYAGHQIFSSWSDYLPYGH